MSKEKEKTKKNRSSSGSVWTGRAVKAVSILLMVVAACMLFVCNRKVPFMMDDEWYSTNLVTGEKLKGFGDIISSQVWHYLNWGGRSITHGLLQLSLMAGETAADIINTMMVLLLAFEMYVLSGIVSTKGEDSKDSGSLWDGITKVSVYALLFGMIIACCPNFKMSMLWQAGCTNYVYSSVWILFFYICYLRTLDSDKKDIPLTWLFIIPLGLITGWSTENMGPSACAVAFFITVMGIRKNKITGNRRFWMITGVVSSFVGSVICILAPGNFIRKEGSTDDLALTFPDRILQMIKGAGLYLFPALLIFALSYIIYRAYFSDKLPGGMIILLMGAILSYGAMILSPYYPDCMAFGTCLLIEICSASMLKRLPDKKGIPGSAAVTCMMLIISMITMYYE